MDNDRYTEIYQNLAQLIRNSAHELLPKSVIQTMDVQPDSPINNLPTEVRLAWLQYELDCIADVVITPRDENDTTAPCQGIDLFSVPGMEIIAPAKAVEGQLLLAKSLMAIIHREYLSNPAMYNVAIDRFEQAFRSLIAVNVRVFSERVTSKVDGLRQETQESLKPCAPDSPTPTKSANEVTSGNTRSHHPSFNDLSPREIEVLRVIAAGKSNGEIAAALNISQNTVKNHIRHMLDKLGYENRVQLSVYAIVNDLVSLDEAREGQQGQQK